MRIFLDTNILVFLYTGHRGDLSRDVQSFMNDYSNEFLTSSVCIHELIHLIQTERIGKKNAARNGAMDIMDWLHNANIAIVPVTEANLLAYAKLPLRPDHNDPNDRLIIAQAISDRIALISSDRKFSQYERDGLDFIFNSR